MTEEQAQPPEEPPVPARQATPPISDAEARYSKDDLMAEAAAFGCYAWDVPGIFSAAGATSMTEAEFRAALAAWRGEVTGA